MAFQQVLAAEQCGVQVGWCATAYYPLKPPGASEHHITISSISIEHHLEWCMVPPLSV